MSFVAGWGKKTGCLGRQMASIAKSKQESYNELKKLSIMAESQVNALKEQGISYERFWGVVYKKGDVPLAILDSKENAEQWKSKRYKRAIIQPYDLQIKIDKNDI